MMSDRRLFDGLSLTGRGRGPAAIGGIAMWLDAARGITLGGGGGVASWADRAGKITAPAQGTQALQPTLTAAAINGLPAVTFTGSLHLIHALQLPKPCTVVAVMKTTVDGSGGYALLGTFGNSIGGTAMFAAANGVSQWGLYHNANALSGQSVRNTFKRCVAIVRDYNDVDLRTDGASVTVATGASAYNAPSFIGCGLVGGGQNMEGSIAELIAYSSALPAGDCKAIEAYLARKYAL
jgi:hypothetical protein